MKHLKKIEQRTSESTTYLYIVSALLLLLNILKKIIIHIPELLMTAAFAGMIISANAFDSGAISYTTLFLFIAILGVLIVAIIKFKISKDGGDK